VLSRELLKAAREQVAAATGREVESISGFRRDEQNGWVVDVEALELRRVPNTMDLLASYSVYLSEDGEIEGFELRRRYHRAQVDESGRG
jgi:hypothetical protein